MAPELLTGRSVNTTASDVYAFGIVLYEVYSRKDPYEGENGADVLSLVCNNLVKKRPPVPEGCPPTIQSLMHDCLVHDPEARPTFEEMDKRLKRVDMKEVQGSGTAIDKFSAHNLSSVSLHDIFPPKVAKALREGKQVEPEQYDVVTIFFSDIGESSSLCCRYYGFCLSNENLESFSNCVSTGMSLRWYNSWFYEYFW